MRVGVIFMAMSAMLGTSLVQAASETFYLNVPGILGDVTARGYEGWISVTSFSEGFSNSSSARSGGGGAARVSCKEFKIVKPLDVTSPHLALAVATDQIFGSIQLAAVSTGNRPIQFLSFTLLNATIDAVSFGGDSDTSARVETLAIRPAKVLISYRPQAADGAPGTPVQATVDCSSFRP
jgi:type VI secretion system secreted protein Hcp